MEDMKFINIGTHFDESYKIWSGPSANFHHERSTGEVVLEAMKRNPNKIVHVSVHIK